MDPENETVDFVSDAAGPLQPATRGALDVSQAAVGFVAGRPRRFADETASRLQRPTMRWNKSRRQFMQSAARIVGAGATFGGLAFGPAPPVHSAGARRPRILLRSSWQVVNIGDIAHTPGILALLEKHFPDAEVKLWASSDLSEAVAAMERRRFPKLEIVKGTLNEQGRASNPALGEALIWSDFLLHGSGPSLVAAKDVAAYVRHQKKPFGVYAITHGSFFSGPDRDLLSEAQFVFFRDGVSLELAQRQGVKTPIMQFAPDGAFACDLRNDAQADAFLQRHQLEQGRFLCCLSRLRYTPYWSIPGSKRPFDAQRHARNEDRKHQDHAPLVQAIVQVVRETPLKVLLCPEDMTQMAVGREQLFGQLPEDVRPRVVWRESFWLTDEALSTYVRSAGLFGSEMHSPIMAIGAGIPALVCRFEEQTSKGFMWRDIGLGDWLFDLDHEEQRAKVAPAVLDLALNLDAARTRTAHAREFVQQRQRETMAIVRTTVERVAVR